MDRLNKEVKDVSNYRNAKEVKVSHADHIYYADFLKIGNLQWVFGTIKEDVWQKRIEVVRAESDNKKRKQIKYDTLGYFNIGEFQGNHRGNNDLISTEFMIFDYDHVGENLNVLKETLKADDKVYGFFVSPSSDGLKVIYRVEEPITDKNLYSSIYKYYAVQFRAELGEDPDKTSDCSRPCYFSYDPDAYLNEYARPLSLDVKLDDIIIQKSLSSKVTDKKYIDEYYSTVKEGARHTSCVSYTGRLINLKISQLEAAEILSMFNKVYCDEPLPPAEVESITKDLYKRYYREKGDFWNIIKTDEGEKVSLDKFKIFKFLENSGFGKIYNGINHTYVRQENNVMDFSHTTQMKDFVRNYIEGDADLAKKRKEQILDAVISSYPFTDDRMEYLQKYDHKIKRDTRDKSFIYYKNCYVEISASGSIETKGYSSLDGIIWKSQIIPRDFRRAEAGGTKSDYELFLRNVVQGDETRFNSLKSVIGYLLHDYKNPTEARAIVLNDEKISENPNGRTGKSIIGKALQKIRKSSRIDGKNFKFDRFAFQQVDLDTKIMDFNDVNKNFDFEKLFSIVTDNLDVEKKNLPSFSMPFEDSPKIIISTNYTLKGEGASYKARMFELEFSDFYNEKHTPVDDFKKIFFDEWDENDWSLFDNFMVECVLHYLQNGLIEIKSINLQKRKLMDNTIPNFVEFMEKRNLGFNIRHAKDPLYMDFIKQYSDFSPLRKNTFTKWLKSYAEYVSSDYIPADSSGKQYFIFQKSEKSSEKVENLEEVLTPFI